MVLNKPSGAASRVTLQHVTRLRAFNVTHVSVVLITLSLALGMLLLVMLFASSFEVICGRKGIERHKPSRSHAHTNA